MCQKYNPQFYGQIRGHFAYELYMETTLQCNAVTHWMNRYPELSLLINCEFIIQILWCTVYPKKYAHGFVVLCFVVVMQSFITNSHEVFIHIHQGCYAGTGAIVRLPQCQWSKPDGYGQNQSMYNHNKAQKSKNHVHISWDILYQQSRIVI